ncbi:HNH endonuclease signature motif containing protein [Kitasatospora sp. NPDC088779]
MDHIIPISQGGTDTADNVQLLCKGCHRAKTRRDMGYEGAAF